MELLITLIGDAAVDPNFRDEFLENPAGTIDKYGFRLTKCDYELMMMMFTKLSVKQKTELAEAFTALQNKLYAPLEQKSIGPCRPPCFMSMQLGVSESTLRKAG
jgi:hypothetical protein